MGCLTTFGSASIITFVNCKTSAKGRFFDAHSLIGDMPLNMGLGGVV